MKREIGSSFYKLESQDRAYQTLAGKTVELRDDIRLYSSGRSAMLAVLEVIHASREVRTIWVPEYYCHNVTGFLERNYDTIQYYYIDPFDYNQDFQFSEFASKEDIIILNNYWGLFEYVYKPESDDRPVIIEDHSHGWLSAQCLNSKADYCISSVRKSYPVAGGGIAWQPGIKDSELGYEDIEDESMEDAYISLHQSLVKKRDYLIHDKGDKENYLNLLAVGESLITESNSFARPNDALFNELDHYIRMDINQIKSSNLQAVLEQLMPSEHYRIVNRESFTPFGLLLLFRDKDKFDQFKDFCLDKNIYPANLWPDNDLKTPWKYFFNIHIDFRYDSDDMKYLADCLNEWTQKSVMSLA